MQYVMRFDVEPNRAGEFRTWLVEHDDTIRSSSREGWTYLGTWFTVQGFGAYQAEVRFEIDDYAALGADSSEDNEKVLQQWMDFVDDRRPVDTSLMKSASDVIILAGS